MQIGIYLKRINKYSRILQIEFCKILFLKGVIKLIKERKFILLTVISTVLISSKVLIVKQTLNQGLPAEQILYLRMLMATPMFLIIYLFYRKKHSSTHIVYKDYWLIGLIGVFGFFLSPLFDFKGTYYIPATIERVLIFSYPLFIFIYSLFSERKQIKITYLYILIGVLLGLLLSINGFNFRSFGNANIKGVILVLIASMLYSISLILSQQVVRRVGSMNLTSLSELIAFLVLVIYFVFTGNSHFMDITKVNLTSYSLILIMVIFSTVIPFFLLNECIKYIGATKVSLISIIGPIFTSFIDVLLLKESISYSQLLGGGLIILSIYFLDFYEKKISVSKHLKIKEEKEGVDNYM